MLAYDPMSNPLNRIEWMFGMLECIHITSFATAVGLIGLVDFRLIGAGLTRHSPVRLSQDTTFWIMGGLIMAVTSGLMLFSTDPERYAVNPAFQLKVVCLIVAILFNYTGHRYAVRAESSRVLQGLAGGVSLVLWIAVIFGGLFYAFTA